MNWQKAFIELDTNIHDRESFDCGETLLNDFIAQQASRFMKSNLGYTMVLPGEKKLKNGKWPICAFYTVTPACIERKTLPPNIRKRLPAYPIPVFLLAQLAVHNDCKEQGLGKITLINALKYIWDINQQMRGFAVIVDCLNESAKTFYKKYDFAPLEVLEGRERLFLEMDTIGQLFQNI